MSGRAIAASHCYNQLQFATQGRRSSAGLPQGIECFWRSRSFWKSTACRRVSRFHYIPLSNACWYSLRSFPCTMDISSTILPRSLVPSDGWRSTSSISYNSTASWQISTAYLSMEGDCSGCRAALVPRESPELIMKLFEHYNEVHGMNAVLDDTRNDNGILIWMKVMEWSNRGPDGIGSGWKRCGRRKDLDISSMGILREWGHWEHMWRPKGERMALYHHPPALSQTRAPPWNTRSVAVLQMCSSFKKTFFQKVFFNKVLSGFCVSSPCKIT